MMHNQVYKKLLPLLFLLILFSSILTAQEVVHKANSRDREPLKQMPRLESLTLEKEKVILPVHCKGRICLLAMEFSRNAQDTLKAWIEHYREAFKGDQRYDYFQMPMLSGFGVGLFYRLIINGIRKKVDRNERNHYLVAISGVKRFRKTMGWDKKIKTRILLLDRNGHIRWQSFGEPVKGKLEALLRTCRMLATESR